MVPSPRRQILSFGGTFGGSTILLQSSRRINRAVAIVAVAGHLSAVPPAQIDLIILYSLDNNTTGTFGSLGTNILHSDSFLTNMKIFSPGKFFLPMYLPIPMGSFIKCRMNNATAAAFDAFLYVILEELPYPEPAVESIPFGA